MTQDFETMVKDAASVEAYAGQLVRDAERFEAVGATVEPAKLPDERRRFNVNGPWLVCLLEDGTPATIGHPDFQRDEGV